MKTFEETMKELFDHPFVTKTSHKYHNSCELSGYLVRKPKFIKSDKGISSCSFLLHQINKLKGAIDYQTFGCMVYPTQLQEVLEKLEKVCYVGVVGKLMYSKKIKGMYLHVLDIKVMCELDIPLAKEWEKKQ